MVDVSGPKKEKFTASSSGILNNISSIILISKIKKRNMQRGGRGWYAGRR